MPHAYRGGVIPIEIQSVPLMGQVAMLPEAPLGPVYSFVPAGGAHDAGGLPKKLTEALRAHLSSEDDGRTVLLANFQKDPAKRIHPQPFTITFVDLSKANPGQEWLAVNMSEAVFVVTATHPLSLDDAAEKAAWVPAIKSRERRGLPFLPPPRGATGPKAPRLTAPPV